MRCPLSAAARAWNGTRRGLASPPRRLPRHEPPQRRPPQRRPRRPPRWVPDPPSPVPRKMQPENNNKCAPHKRSPPNPDPPSQAPSPSAAERTHEVRERLIRAVTNILNPLVNPPPLQEQCVVTLHTMVKNIADHPTDPKYRRVKASSRSITQKVVACRGGEEFLTAAGWRKVAIDYEAYLTCESTVPMDTLR